MPELPEVETIARKLNLVLQDKVIVKCFVYRDKSFIGLPSVLFHRRIVNVSRRSKLIRFQLDNHCNLLVHLKMTGQFIFINKQIRVGGGHPSSDWVNKMPSKHTRVEFRFHDDSRLYFNDMRVFGWLKVLSDEAVDQEYLKYGPDINTKEASIAYFFNQLQKTSRKIKQVVMDNRVVAGVGNIYACDGLNLAKINPVRKSNSLSYAESTRLLASLKQVINLGIKFGGATINNYLTVDGFAGKYQDVVRVYGKEGLSCPNCGNKIEKIKVAGRGTYYCSSCQK